MHAVSTCRIRRPAAGASLVLLLGVVAALVACRADAPAAGCACGLGGGAVVNLECGVSDASPTASAGCQVASQPGGRLAVTTSSPGTCHVQWASADGTPMATDVSFSEGWLACGSDPQGCGQALVGPAPTIDVLCDGGVHVGDE